MASSTLDVSRAELALVVMYLNKAEARDKLCRAIQYGSKFLSGGQPGTAQNVDKSTSLARKVFRLFKFVNDLHGLISPVPKGTPLPLVLLGKSKNALLSTFLFLDQIVWLGRSGIYKNKERAELLGRISLFCWMGSSVCTTLVELGEIGRLSSSMKKIEKGLKNGNKYQDEEYRAKLKKSNERSLALIKSAMDIAVAAGLLQLSPEKITPRITGAFGFITSIISCYQVLKKLKFCRHDQDPDMAWYTKMDSCLTPLPEVDEAEDLKTVAGGKVEKWPARLNAVPPRINNGDLKEITPEGFLGDTKLWKQRVSYYKTLDYQLGETGRYRNILDMNAYVGGFAAALADEPVWVMNVVPVEAKLNTLGVIYERGLIGTYQNWCEAMSTYPRTYDFIHADSVFTLYQDKCEPEDILLEMDRILRPGGGVIIRDDVDVLIKVKELTKGLQWEGRIADHEKSPHERVKIYYAVKQYWTVTAPEEDKNNPIFHHRVCSDTLKMHPVYSSSSSPATNDVSSPLLNRVLPSRSSQPLRGAASRLLRRASSRGMMLRESSVRVRETAAEQIEERQSEWAYSKPVIVLDVVWNLAFVLVTVGVLWFSSEENPRVPLRFWIAVYNLQCLLHVVCVISEYRRRHGYDQLNQDSDSGLTSSEGSSEDESDGLEIESGTSLAKHLESTNAIFSFVWWIIGFYWISAGSEELAQSSPQLYWLCVAFLAFDVIFLVLCVAVASLIAIAVCCCLPCIIAVLYALAEQEGASDEEIERLPRLKFLTVRNSEKVNGEILETHGGIMTQLGVDSPSERVLSSDEAECCVCLCEYEDGTELRELWCRHHFHEACIDKWLRINATCPLCKSNILKTDEQSGNDAV
ncbi:unnamed protein product [Brassica rapa]|uniref:RING-type domain-containing protein n=1 Tax=Brassica campestris TaxID=3711 RepID=A0A8D9MDV9_BRACM|nr:unnamed protein product [Brassica rapa]